MPTLTQLQHFLTFFPEIELPITLSDDAHHTFSAHNLPLPMPYVHLFLEPQDDAPTYPPTPPADHDDVIEINDAETSDDDTTEYVPCFRIPEIEREEIAAVVYWRATFRDLAYAYEYFLVTFDKKAEKISHKSIGGTTLQMNGTTPLITNRVATIDENLFIYIAEGQSTVNTPAHHPNTNSAIAGETFDTSADKVHQFELQNDGRIVAVRSN